MCFLILASLIDYFMKEFQVPEAQVLYGFQTAKTIMQLKLHSLLLEIYITVSKEKNCVFHAIETIPCIAKKTYWDFCCIETI